MKFFHSRWVSRTLTEAQQTNPLSYSPQLIQVIDDNEQGGGRNSWINHDQNVNLGWGM
jgi:hypothetical protein